MMKKEHTPGPYTVELCNEPGIFNGSYMITAPDRRYQAPEEERVIVCRLPTGAGIYSQQFADATLLAAAPEHLEALKMIEQKTWFNDGDPVDLKLTAIGEIWNIARRAILKSRAQV